MKQSLDLGSKIAEARIKEKLTQAKVSEWLDITPEHLSAIENNRRKPSVELLIKISEKLDVSMDYIFGKENLDTSEIKNLLSEFEKLGITNEVLIILQNILKIKKD